MLALRDTPIGQLLRSTGFKRYFLFPEEIEESRHQILEDLEKQRETVVHSSSSQEGPTESPNDLQNTSTDLSPEKIADKNEIKTTINHDDVLIVTWYGPGDPGNPRNWASRKKAWVTIVICFYTFVVYGASSIIVPANG